MRSSRAVGAGFSALLLVVLGAGSVRAEKYRGWPFDTAGLRELPATYSIYFGVRKVFIDPGHGSADNTGNLSAFCVDEQSVALSISEDLERCLDASQRFDADLSRRAAQVVPYAHRVEAANLWGAEVLLSIHTDVRGDGVAWSPRPQQECLRLEGEPGVAVLWSDAGNKKLVARRQELARTLAREIGAAGFPLYSGDAYLDKYEPDPKHPGVLRDRRQRVFMLRSPTMPAVIIETHHALYPEEARRWEGPHTRNMFCSAVRAALVKVLERWDPLHAKGKEAK